MLVTDIQHHVLLTTYLFVDSNKFLNESTKPFFLKIHKFIIHKRVTTQILNGPQEIPSVTHHGIFVFLCLLCCTSQGCWNCRKDGTTLT